MVKDMFGDIRYKVGLHIHTTQSDGRVSPKEAARIYKAAGYDAIALTDHWKYQNGGETEGLTILSGCEYNVGAADTSVDVMHIVGFGMRYDPGIEGKSTPRQEVIDRINAAGGIAVLAHPAWSLNTPEEALALKGFGAVEIYNTVSNVMQSSRPYSGYFVDLLANKGVEYPLIATDDTHYYAGEDETKSFIMVKAASGNAEDLMAAIRKGDFYASQGPELHVRREGEKIIADCSPCVMIDFLSNSAWCPDRIYRGENLTHAEYTLKEWDKWVRVEVHDANGCDAWSSVIRIK